MINKQSRTSVPVLSRFKVFEEKHHLNRKVYRNRGVLKDAERFSLVDTVLDGEYNDYEILEFKKAPIRERIREAGKQFRKGFVNLTSAISSSIFRVILVGRLAVYYLFHIGYKAE